MKLYYVEQGTLHIVIVTESMNTIMGQVVQCHANIPVCYSQTGIYI